VTWRALRQALQEQLLPGQGLCAADFYIMAELAPRVMQVRGWAAPAPLGRGVQQRQQQGQQQGQQQEVGGSSAAVAGGQAPQGLHLPAGKRKPVDDGWSPGVLKQVGLNAGKRLHPSPRPAPCVAAFLLVPTAVLQPHALHHLLAACIHHAWVHAALAATATYADICAVLLPQAAKVDREGGVLDGAGTHLHGDDCCCLLPAACCLLPAACCLLPAACCLLPAACSLACIHTQ
jgi:hypothetical protein